MTGGPVGQPLRRKEDPRLLRGRGRYVDDLALPGMVQLAFVRSPHAHAAVTGVDVSAARRVPGVTAVFRDDDLPVRPIVAEFHGPGYAGGRWPALAGSRVRFVGEAVAAVAAVDRYVAEDAVDRIAVAYAPLPPLTSAEEALRPEAPRLHDDVPGNVYFRAAYVHGAVDEAFAGAPVLVRGTFRHQRIAGGPLEGRGIVAAWDARERLTVWACTQVPHILRRGLARFLDLRESQIRVVAPEVGGGFGPKMHLYPEDLVVCAAAHRLGCPVKWVEDRRENLLTMTQAREQVIEAAAVADRGGRILAVRAEIVGDAGAYSVFPLTAALEPMGTAQIIPGPYRVPAYAYTAMAVGSNKPPVGAYRGVGMGIGVFVMERLIDKVAAAIGADPIEVRRINFIRADEFPHTSPTGLVYDSGRYEDTLDAALAAFRYTDAREEQARGRSEGRLIGIGVSAFTEYTGMGSTTFARRGMTDVRGDDSARIVVDDAGHVRAHPSCPSQGQGHETVFAQLVAAELGVDPAQVTVVPVDTDLTPEGSGTFGSRAVIAGGGALRRAAEEVNAKAVAIAARLLEAAPRDVIADRGRFAVRGVRGRSVAWAEVARAAHAPAAAGLLPSVEMGLEATASYDPPPAAFSNGAHLALVEVDRHTGRVAVLRYVIAEDCGPLVNPLLVEGQIHGGLAQGLGEAFLEEVRYDDAGQPLTATFMDYLLPAAVETPSVKMVHLETPSPFTAGGFKGMGESATIGAPACIANAVSDALGRSVDALPITPPRVLGWLCPAPSEPGRPPTTP
ncbi:MAG TPA: xanthine dehydrogenase family protein molybdopterin-binding subunit [bacterium]|nr:xanthine dehydrogenase family protein molybdopterin-binding subunit [bacterium]